MLVGLACPTAARRARPRARSASSTSSIHAIESSHGGRSRQRYADVAGDQRDQDGVPDHDPADLVEGGHPVIVPARRTETCSSLRAWPRTCSPPRRLGPVRLRNRTVKAATFEGRTPDGQVTDELIDYHLAVARGGVGLTTVAYLAVAPEGRTHREQIVVGPETRAGLARLAEAIHQTGAADRRPGRPRRAGRQRPVQRRARAQREPDAEPAVDADGPVRLRAAT